MILMHHAFEMPLKAIVCQRRGAIYGTGTDNTHGFDSCLGIARGDLNIVSEDEAKALPILNDLRDCATHNLIDLTEPAHYR